MCGVDASTGSKTKRKEKVKATIFPIGENNRNDENIFDYGMYGMA